jgi:hypothetical protein
MHLYYVQDDKYKDGIYVMLFEGGIFFLKEVDADE